MLKRTLLLGGEKYLKPDGDSLAWHGRNDDELMVYGDVYFFSCLTSVVSFVLKHEPGSL